MPLSPRLLFLSFLGLGLISGLFLGSLSQAIAAGPQEPEGQQNVLFVLVDDLSGEQPTLQGIWLAARGADSSEFNWMPIYPAPLQDAESEYAKPHLPVHVNGAQFIEVSALAPLRAEGAWWGEVFWVDRAALSALQNAAGGAPVAFTDAWSEPQAALFEQVQVLSTLCAHEFSAADKALLDQMLALMPQHVRSSVNPFELITSWDAWSSEGFNFSCTHPWAD